MSDILNKARLQRQNIVKASQSLPDKEASQTPEFFDTLKADGSLVKAGTRINWQGVLKKATVDLWDTVENNPDNAPTLWADLEYKDGIRIIPETITTTTLFSKGELGWWKDALYESLVDANVYTPEQYPPNWKQK